MKSRKYLMSLLAVALFLAGSVAAFAQAPIRGKVQLKKANGTTAPVENATVHVYRMDIATGQLPSVKTDAKGEFSIPGAAAGQVFALVVSAPGMKASLTPDVKAGANLAITGEEGDGTAPTEELVREAIEASRIPADSAEAKKKQAEIEKRRAEVEARNKKVETSTAVIRKALDEGTKAFEAKNYDLAVAKFDEGFQADQEFVGTAPILLNNKAIALRLRAVENYNTGIKSSDPAQKTEKVNAARKDFQDSLEAYTKAYQILKNAPAEDIKDQNIYNKSKYDSLSGITEVYRLMAQTRMADSSKAVEARTAFQDYIAVETDAAKKARAQYVLADVLREAGDFDNAIPEYRKALEASPDNADALAGLGLSLFSVGVTKDDKAQMQEGLNFMERFAQVAPETHPLKASVKDAVTYLKTEQKLTPQKTTPARKRN